MIFSSLFLFVLFNVWRQGRFGKVYNLRIHLPLTNGFCVCGGITDRFLDLINYLQFLEKFYTVYQC